MYCGVIDAHGQNVHLRPTWKPSLPTPHAASLLTEVCPKLRACLYVFLFVYHESSAEGVYAVYTSNNLWACEHSAHRQGSTRFGRNASITKHDVIQVSLRPLLTFLHYAGYLLFCVDLCL